MQDNSQNTSDSHNKKTNIQRCRYQLTNTQCAYGHIIKKGENIIKCKNYEPIIENGQKKEIQNIDTESKIKEEKEKKPRKPRISKVSEDVNSKSKQIVKKPVKSKGKKNDGEINNPDCSQNHNKKEIKSKKNTFHIQCP